MIIHGVHWAPNCYSSSWHFIRRAGCCCSREATFRTDKLINATYFFNWFWTESHTNCAPTPHDLRSMENLGTVLFKRLFAGWHNLKQVTWKLQHHVAQCQTDVYLITTQNPIKLNLTDWLTDWLSMWQLPGSTWWPSEASLGKGAKKGTFVTTSLPKQSVAKGLRFHFKMETFSVNPCFVPRRSLQRRRNDAWWTNFKWNLLWRIYARKQTSCYKVQKLKSSPKENMQWYWNLSRFRLWLYRKRPSMSATNYKPAFGGFFAGRLTACSNHQNLKQSTLNSLELALTTFGFGFFMGTTSSKKKKKCNDNGSFSGARTPWQCQIWNITVSWPPSASDLSKINIKYHQLISNPISATMSWIVITSGSDPERSSTGIGMLRLGRLGSHQENGAWRQHVGAKNERIRARTTQWTQWQKGANRSAIGCFFWSPVKTHTSLLNL